MPGGARGEPLCAHQRAAPAMLREGVVAPPPPATSGTGSSPSVVQNSSRTERKVAPRVGPSACRVEAERK
jgi:hypothetical protein